MKWTWIDYKPKKNLKDWTKLLMKSSTSISSRDNEVDGIEQKRKKILNSFSINLQDGMQCNKSNKKNWWNWKVKKTTVMQADGKVFVRKQKKN